MQRADQGHPPRVPSLVEGHMLQQSEHLVIGNEPVGSLISTQHSSLSSTTNRPCFLIQGARWVKVPLNSNIPQCYVSLYS